MLIDAVAPCHGSRIHPCGGAAVRCHLSYMSSSEKCGKCVIIHNISVNVCIMYVLIISLNSVHVRLLYTYNLNIEANEVGPDSRQVPFRHLFISL